MGIIHDERLRAFFAAHQDAMFAELMELVRIPSISREDKAEPGAPFGRECRLVLEAVQALYARHGFASTIYDEGYLLAYAGNLSAERKITVLAHADVVPVDDQWQVTAPFEPIIKDGYIFGRGTMDNKCAIIYALYIAIAMREGILPFNKKLEIFVGTNEECGMLDVQAYKRTHGLPESAMIIDSGFPGAYAEKSIYHIHAISPKMTDVISAHGGEAYNVVCSEVTVRVRGNDKRAALEAAADEHIRVSEEDGDTVLSVRGMSKHVSNPDGSLNAMLLAAKALAACGIDQAVMDVAATVLADYEGAFCGIKEGDNAELRLTFANGMVRTNDGRLELTFDMRFVADKGIEVHAEKLNAWFAAHGWEFIVKEGEPGYRIPESDPKLSIVLDEYNRMTGENAKLFYMSGGTYGRMLEGRAMPSGLSLYGSWATLPAGHGGGHQPDEYIPCDGFLNAIEFHARVLARLSDV